MRFIKAKFNAGLGNQLFQYATARGLMKKNDKLFFDISSYGWDYLDRKFSLPNFQVKGAIIKKNQFEKFFTPGTKFNKVINAIGQFKDIKEEGFFIHQGLKEQVKWFTNIQGYWQSPVYFNELRKELLEELVPRELPSTQPEWVNQKNTVAIGVRRTDYLVDTKYGFIGEQYYRDAIQLMKSKIDNPLFVIFTDDLAWCKNFFKDEQFIFCDDENWSKDYLKVYLMSKCKHQIISNSSFYWWGAWLNKNPNKIIIRPSVLFNDSTLFYEAHFPEEWLIVNNK